MIAMLCGTSVGNGPGQRGCRGAEYERLIDGVVDQQRRGCLRVLGEGIRADNDGVVDERPTRAGVDRIARVAVDDQRVAGQRVGIPVLGNGVNVGHAQRQRIVARAGQVDALEALEHVIVDCRQDE